MGYEQEQTDDQDHYEEMCRLSGLSDDDVVITVESILKDVTNDFAESVVEFYIERRYITMSQREALISFASRY